MVDETQSEHTVAPGELLRAMLAEKGWTQDTLATITKTSRVTINNIITGRSGISADIAMSLAAAFGNEPAYWMEADVAYRLSLAEQDEEIVRRGRLFEMAPIHDMKRRGWIKGESTETLHKALNGFFGGDILKNDIRFPVAPRRTQSLSHLNAAEKAWCFRAYNIASTMLVPAFSRKKLDECERKLKRLAAYPKEIERVPKVLSEYGIRLVVIEPIPTVKLDGATFWIDEAPVIALSMRYDRIDCFWFTLMHEFAHISRGDALSFDVDLLDNAEGITIRLVEDEAEREANEMASNSLIPSKEMESFISRVGPLYSSERVIQFAHRVKIHPGIIVGQLQHRKEIGYSALRSMLVKVRGIVTATALTDGWKNTISDSV